METYTVSFFGHRRIYGNFSAAEKKIETKVAELINNKDYVNFLVGRNGDFDIYVSSIIRKAKEKYDYKNTAFTLVLPYMTAEFRDNVESFGKFYDEVEICPESASAHFKAAIQIRNRCMVDRSDLVICYIEHNSGGAYKTVQYAKQQKCEIINVANI